MARPERLNVDYFPHPCKHGKKMKYIEKKYGNGGYKIWFTILEQLGDANYHYLDLNSPITLTYLVDLCNVEEELFLKIINELVFLGEFDKMLWETECIIFSEKFICSIEDAYKRRNNKLLHYLDLCQHLVNINRINVDINEVNAYNNAQRIGKDRIENNNKEFTEYDNDFIEWLKKAFKISELNNFDKVQKISRAIHLMKSADKYEYFRECCWFYFKYKKETGEKIHNLDSFLGSFDQGLEDGGWNKANWKEKLKDIQTMPDDKPTTYPGRFIKSDKPLISKANEINKLKKNGKANT